MNKTINSMLEVRIAARTAFCSYKPQLQNKKQQLHCGLFTTFPSPAVA